MKSYQSGVKWPEMGTRSISAHVLGVGSKKIVTMARVHFGVELLWELKARLPSGSLYDLSYTIFPTIKTFH